MQGREQWASNTGFIMACIGSAIGLGNIWRFPYIVGTNGGGAFLIPYVIITICFGLAFMLIEFSVGRHYQTSVITSIMRIKQKFRWAGVFVILITFAILSYYLVVLGWILSFFIASIFDINLDFQEYTNSFYPLLSFFIVVGFNFVILRKGIVNGVEKLNKIGIILLISMLVPLAAYGMSLPGAEEGLSYYLTPNFEKLNEPEIWSIAFGQVFFSLSLGTGILLTYISYVKGKISIVKSSSIVIATNGMVSFVAGLMIFSIVFAFGMNPEEGATLVLQVLPSIFESMEYGQIIGISFFFLLLVAGLTSSVSMFQVQVSALEDTVNFSKSKAVSVITILVLGVGTLSALSYSSMNLELFETPFFDLMDTYFGTYGLSISAVVLIVIVTWFMDKKKIIEQINQYSKIKIPEKAIDVAKFVLPGAVIALLVFTIISG